MVTLVQVFLAGVRGEGLAQASQTRGPRAANIKKFTFLRNIKPFGSGSVSV